MADRPLSSYEGEEPYVFVAYSHEDSDLVYPQIRWLQDQGFNIVWDEGVSPGAVWRREIAEAIRGCSLLLFFTTTNSVVSEHCTREVNFALDEHHRPVLAVHLSKTVLPDALALSLSDRQAILQHELAPEDYQRKLLASIASYLELPVPAVRVPLATQPRRSKQRVQLALAVVISLSVGAALATYVSGSANPPIEATTAGMQLPLSLQHFSHHATQFRNLALSPDGRQIAYIGVQAGETFLYVKSVDNPRSEKFPDTNGAATPFYSPDGKWIGFYAKGKIRRSPANGGRPVDIASFPQLQRGLSWGDDGAIVFSPGFRDPLWSISADGGEATKLTVLEDHTAAQHSDPFVLPGSRQVLHGRSSNAGEPEIWLTDLASSDSRRLISGRWPQYHDGNLLFVRGAYGESGSIWVVNFDAEAGEIIGDPVPMVDSANSPFSVSNNGCSVVEELESHRDRAIWW